VCHQQPIGEYPTVVGYKAGSIDGWATASSGRTVKDMTPQLSARILIILSICYGLAVAAIAALDGPVTTFAIIGALIIGGLWAVRGVMGGGR
jgi:hypothetical protein